MPEEPQPEDPPPDEPWLEGLGDGAAGGRWLLRYASSAFADRWREIATSPADRDGAGATDGRLGGGLAGRAYPPLVDGVRGEENDDPPEEREEEVEGRE